MHVHLFLRVGAEQRKKLRYLLLTWGRPATHRNLYKVDAKGFGSLAFPLRFRKIFSAKIHDRGYPQGAQLFHPLRVWLSPSVQGRVDPAAIGEAANLQSFPVSGARYQLCASVGGGRRCAVRLTCRRWHENQG